jgi:hypothetical protein
MASPLEGLLAIGAAWSLTGEVSVGEEGEGSLRCYFQILRPSE